MPDPLEPIDHTADVLDSRDIIERIEYLEELEEAVQEARDALADARDDGVPPEDLEALQKDVDSAYADFGREEDDELGCLRRLADEASCSSDWAYGETLIHESYFAQYIEELIDDCYEIPDGLNSGEWPWRHMTMDYESAASEAKQDYMEVDFYGSTYYIRC